MAISKNLFWNLYARVYDGLLNTVPYQRLLKQSLQHIPSGALRVLDAGCGTGNLLQAAQARHLRPTWLAIDFSPTMLGRARTKNGNAMLIQGDLNGALPFSDRTFDVVTCINVLHAVADPFQTLSELQRILEPGGTLIVSSPLCRARIGPLIREHAEAIGWVRTLPKLTCVVALVIFNLLIVARGRRNTYHFMDAQTVRRLFAARAVQASYAGQNWFACVTKGKG